MYDYTRCRRKMGIIYFQTVKKRFCISNEAIKLFYFKAMSSSVHFLGFEFSIKFFTTIGLLFCRKRARPGNSQVIISILKGLLLI